MRSAAESKQKKEAIAKSDIHSREAQAKMKQKMQISADFFKPLGLKDGLQIWHIEQFQLHEVPPPKHGQFFEGDSYVVLCSAKVGGQQIHHVHYWIGETSTPDEFGSAAYAGFQIEEHFKGKSTLHREVMSHESDQFKSFFPHGMQILAGGVPSGFHHVDRKAEFKARLRQVKGKKHIQIVEIPIALSSLNSGDVFLLDTLTTIFVFLGKECSPFERNKGGTFAHALQEQNQLNQKVVMLEEGRDDNAEFWQALGGKGPIKPASEGGADLDADAGKSMGLKKAFRVSDTSGQVKIDPVGEGKLNHTLLKSQDVFVIDSGYEIFVWIGHGADSAVQQAGMHHAQTYLNTSGRPPYLPISKLSEGVHLPSFEAIFATV